MPLKNTGLGSVPQAKTTCIAAEVNIKLEWVLLQKRKRNGSAMKMVHRAGSGLQESRVILEVKDKSSEAASINGTVI